MIRYEDFKDDRPPCTKPESNLHRWMNEFAKYNKWNNLRHEEDMDRIARLQANVDLCMEKLGLEPPIELKRSRPM